MKGKPRGMDMQPSCFVREIAVESTIRKNHAISQRNGITDECQSRVSTVTARPLRGPQVRGPAKIHAGHFGDGLVVCSARMYNRPPPPPPPPPTDTTSAPPPFGSVV